MTVKSLIPTFEVGEKVLLHYRPYEMKCPYCGRIRGIEDDIPDEIVTVVAELGRWLSCHKCKGIIPMPGGFVPIRRDDDHFSFAVPYTLLEKIGGIK